MRLLLDTHVLLWLMQSDSRLKPSARSLIVKAAEVYVSSASIWEIAIKWRLGKIEEDPKIIAASLDSAGLKELPVTHQDALATVRLPLLHGDPFDRLLIAQAMTAPMRFLTADAKLAEYSEVVVTI